MLDEWVKKIIQEVERQGDRDNMKIEIVSKKIEGNEEKR
jgi:hypothetical protein